MAIKSSLSLIARRISQAVRASTAAQGLAPGDFALVGSFDERTDRISLTLGTDRQVDERRLYSDTFLQIRRLFPEFPQITMHVGLVIRSVQNLDEVYLDFNGAEDELDLTEMLERA
jgi:hypothetical protein